MAGLAAMLALVEIVGVADRPVMEMDAEDRADAGRLHRHAMLSGQLIQPVAQPVAEAVHALQPVGRQDLRQRRVARRHRQHIVVEGAAMRE